MCIDKLKLKCPETEKARLLNVQFFAEHGKVTLRGLSSGSRLWRNATYNEEVPIERNLHLLSQIYRVETVRQWKRWPQYNSKTRGEGPYSQRKIKRGFGVSGSPLILGVFSAF